ncbi:TetR/AcrR family transcriptional regulator [Streptomyces sp. RB6PN25]|uniref:TetR/AcrR family transcriptional regulator n=1 Tax=Streptomyces humicola TaxID=2953240 RepID=A0ABT1PYP0_9ACTN|nr:TetR/AcrR family transcriptional regulator [Streptomyces humicola]MCQ4082798.1 TetR/AcrR family transcriptional regulator [Streptomyces humicola]
MSTTTRQAATAARKDQIIRAAIALLAERGYQATTFEAICDKAGLSSKRLITYHFSSKDELFAAVADQIVTDAEAHMQPALGAATDARELLAALIRANVAFIAGHLEQMRALQQIILNGGRAWDRHHLESLNRLAGLFDNGQRTGAFRPCNSQIMAAALRASLDSTYGLLSAGLGTQRCASELVELFDRATRPA